MAGGERVLEWEGEDEKRGWTGAKDKTKGEGAWTNEQQSLLFCFLGQEDGFVGSKSSLDQIAPAGFAFSSFLRLPISLSSSLSFKMKKYVYQWVVRSIRHLFRRSLSTFLRPVILFLHFHSSLSLASRQLVESSWISRWLLSPRIFQVVFARCWSVRTYFSFSISRKSKYYSSKSFNSLQFTWDERR